MSDGTLRAWGHNAFGQLGDGTTISRSQPVAVDATALPPGVAVTAIAAGRFHSVALLSNGTLLAWGQNFFGQLGDGTTTDRPMPDFVLQNPPAQGLLSGVMAVAAGAFHTVALLADGSLRAWGRNHAGQLGNGSAAASSPSPVSPSLANVPPGTAIVALASGGDHSLILLDDGGVLSWGLNDFGQLGTAGGANANVPVPVAAIPASATVTAVAAGHSHSVARLSDGTLLAWGRNDSGQLGNGSFSPASGAVPVFLDPGSGTLLGGVTSIAAGGSHTLAQLADGTVRSWGSNLYGELGDATTTDRSVPTVVAEIPSGGSPAIGLAAGARHSLALVGDGRVLAWGRNEFGQLGDASTVASSVPVRAALPGKVDRIVAGSAHSAVLLGNRTLRTFGENLLGQLGDGTLGAGTSLPSLVLEDPLESVVLAGVSEVAAGKGHTVALGPAGALWSWGDNAFGQLGDGTTAGRPVPLPVLGLPVGLTVRAIATGGYHTLALLEDGTLWAWGRNNFGQVGDGTTLQRTLPVAVDLSTLPPGVGPVAVAAGTFHSLASFDDGSIRAWGQNAFGQLGDGTTQSHSSPVLVNGSAVPPGVRATCIAAGAFHSLALYDDGVVRAWGYNLHGQLGDGTTDDHSVPIPLLPGSLPPTGIVTAIAAGADHSLLLLDDGTARAWGRNDWGQLGDGTTESRSSPVPVVDPATGTFLDGIVALSAGELHTLANRRR
jgi:alpha-tubulin suppressor-like RCC1 family protein